MLERLTDKLSQIARQISGKAAISEKNVQDVLEEIKVALLEADVHVRVVRRFVNRAMEEATGETVLKSVSPGQQFVKVVYDKLVQFLPDRMVVKLVCFHDAVDGSGDVTLEQVLDQHR